MNQIKIISLITCLLLSANAFSATKKIGNIIKLQGEVRISTKKSTRRLKEKESFRFARTYFIEKRSMFTAQLLPGTFLRGNPETEFNLDLDETEKNLVLNISKGSLKVLFSRHLNKDQIKNLIINAQGLVFQGEDTKFTFERDDRKKTITAFVEKGTIKVSNGSQEKVLHAGEKIWIEEHFDGIPEPQKMKDSELLFIKKSGYLKEAMN